MNVEEQIKFLENHFTEISRLFTNSLEEHRNALEKLKYRLANRR
jgi:hypothetical protein